MPPLFRVPADALMPASLRQETQSYVASRQPEGLPASLARRMALNPTDAMLCDSRYNVPMLNAYIFYVGLTVRQSDVAFGGTHCQLLPARHLSSPQMAYALLYA